MIRTALQTLFRMAPWPTAAGLRRVGSPDASSPVLVTGNYDLTVRRLVRALRGQDVWLVVAPSSGINVWCAAAGGHFGTHQVVTALKTSGVEAKVSHRRAILPQLAATGVERIAVKRRSGWNVRFGPVYAEDLPRYLEAGGRKSDDMRRVHFSARERSEMALAWGGPAALLTGAVALALRSSWAGPLAALSLVLGFLVFFVYDRLPGPRRALLTVGAAAGAGCITALAGGTSVAALGACVAAALLCLILTFDYTGSTPLEGGSHFAERHFQIRLDLERCKGVYSCWEVCPEACFEKPEPDSDVAIELAASGRKGRPPVALAHDDRCIRCGACIVQCPLDALAFEDDAGQRIDPDVIRRFKLNLLGTRGVEVGGRSAAD